LRWRLWWNWANHVIIRASSHSGIRSLPSPCTSGARDMPKTGKRKMVSEDIYFVGRRTVEQPPPRSRGIILIQVKNSAPRRMFEMHRMQHGISHVQQWSLADEMTNAICPGVCPGAGIAWTPGTISFSDSSNSMHDLRGGRFFIAQLTSSSFTWSSSPVLRKSGLEVQKSHSVFDITCRAFGNAGLPLVSSTPPIWSGWAWVKTTVVISSVVMPSAL
jgi:hypothetical protein